ncbi:MAG TPA: tRNA (cytidine(34)-2'-O)-methyltransferase [Elusimicrobiales bacterium]|nr:tRNA (cytidine(34)-2'-O)-methyltransferase [Elusimicrobiales bacterium]
MGRTCVGTGTMLHLVGKLGFKIEEKEIRRSGLDYWPRLKYRRYADFDSFLESLPEKSSLFFFSTKGKKSFWDARFEKDSYLVFGSESFGFPSEFYKKYAEKMYRIPINGDIRSLNLSSSVAVALFESLRQTL